MNRPESQKPTYQQRLREREAAAWKQYMQPAAAQPAKAAQDEVSARAERERFHGRSITVDMPVVEAERQNLAAYRDMMLSSEQRCNELQAELERVKQESRDWQGKIMNLASEHERVTKERDELLAELESLVAEMPLAVLTEPMQAARRRALEKICEFRGGTPIEALQSAIAKAAEGRVQ